MENTVITIYYCVGTKVVLKLVNLSLETMRSILVCLSLLSVLVAVTSIAVDGDSNCKVATLVTTMETTLAQLKSEIKENCCQSNKTGSNFLVNFFVPFVFTSQCMLLYTFLGRSVIFLVQGSLHESQVSDTMQIFCNISYHSFA